MIIEVPNENSIVKWKNDEKDEWKVAEISDLIKAYERPQVTVFAENASKEEIEDFKQELENVLERPQDCSDCKRYDFPYFEVKFDKEQMQELVDKAKAEVLASIERSQSEWIPVSERLPEEKINPYTNDFDEVLCTTDWGEVQAFKFGTPIIHHKPHFWLGGAIMDEHIIAWQYKPEPYKEGGAE